MDDEKYYDADGDEMVFPPGMPDELKEKIAGQAQRMGGIRADLEMRLFSLFTEADEEALVTLRVAFGQIARSDDPASLAMYYEGIVVGALARGFARRGITMEPVTIGKSSVPGTSDDMFEQLDEDVQQLGMSGVSTPIADVHPGLASLESDDNAPPPRREPVDVYEEYNVVQVRGGGVECRGCGMVYVSIEDRMKRKPDECSGCHQKARWG